MASKLVGAVKSLLGIAESIPGFSNASPTWEDRLQEAAYTSPSGKRIVFLYEDVSTEVDKRTAAFEYPGVDESYVQDNGYGSRRYPLRVIFWGASHDLLATAFELALLENGPGKLEHPMYGTKDVVPFGTITRRDDLKSAANQSIIEVTFWTTLTELYPLVVTSPRSALLAALDGFDAAAASQFAATMRLSKAVAKTNSKATIRDQIGKASAALSKVAAVSSGALQDFRDAQSTVNLGLDVLIGQPLLLAQQITNLMSAPSRALAGIKDRLLGYNAFYESIFDSKAGSSENDSVELSSVALRTRNDFHISDLFVLSAIGGSARSVAEHTFSTKPEAISAAEAVIAQLDEVIAWREERFGALAEVDTGEAIQALQAVVSLVAAYLVEISFTLVPERRIVLDKPRTIIDLAAELYGSVDDRLDFLIESNGLTGSEILEIPRGRVIAYYT